MFIGRCFPYKVFCGLSLRKLLCLSSLLYKAGDRQGTSSLRRGEVCGRAGGIAYCDGLCCTVFSGGVSLYGPYVGE